MMSAQASLGRFERDHGRFSWSETADELVQRTQLTYSEAEALAAVETEDVGVRELARQTGRSPGTISNLLRRARQKAGEAT